MNKTAQDIAKSIAKQIAQEPAEILKDVGEQVVGEQPFPKISEKQPPGGTDTSKEEQEARDDAFARRRTLALQKEIEDIRKQATFSDLQNKISEGVDVYPEEYPGLSIEQKQVLKAQMEAVKIQKQQAAYQNGIGEVPTIHSKPSRRFGAGQKHEAEKAQTRVEKPVPPSG